MHLNLFDEFCSSANNFSPIARVRAGDKKLDLESMPSASLHGLCQNIQHWSNKLQIQISQKLPRRYFILSFLSEIRNWT